MSPTAFDLFEGAGGARCGLLEAGFDVTGFERWAVAADTADANYHRPTVRCDLMDFDWAGWATPALLWGSPPCQPFSAAGDQEGEGDDRDCIPGYVNAVGRLLPAVAILENVKGLSFEKHADYVWWLVRTLSSFGYVSEWKILDVADFGVPQNRERFILISRRDGRPIRWPEPTHTAGDSLFLEPWVTMADALGWGYQQRPSPCVTGGGGATGGAEPFGHAARDALNAYVLDTHRGQELDGTTQTRDPHTAPAPALTAKAGGQWTLHTNQNTGEVGNPYERAVDRPAPAMTSRGDMWTLKRPSTSIACDPRVAGPGHKGNGVDAPRQMDNAIRLTVEQAAQLQDFPDGYVFTGTKTARFTQIGNAVPRTLARVLAEANR